MTGAGLGLDTKLESSKFENKFEPCWFQILFVVPVWIWTQILEDDGSPFRVTLTDNPHSLTVRTREPGTQLDRVGLCSDPKFVPSDAIPAADDYVEFTVNTNYTGIHNLDFRYALESGNRPLELQVNGVVALPIIFNVS